MFGSFTPTRPNATPNVAALPPLRPVPPVQQDTPGSAESMAPHDAAKLRAAATRAKLLYPGPVGELLGRELLGMADLQKAFGPCSLTSRAAHQILTTPLPGPS